jgi:hypothetical protein
MEEEKEVRSTLADAPARAEQDGRTDAVQHESQPRPVQRGGLAHAVEQVTLVLRDAKHAPPGYLIFLMAIAVILFSMYALWLFRPR